MGKMTEKIKKMTQRSEKSKAQVAREYNAMVNINVFKAIKMLLEGRKEIQSAVELNIGGLKVRVTDKEKLKELINSEIEQLELYSNNEPSTYDPQM
jgi:tryptophanyl-tRNA synthetase